MSEISQAVPYNAYSSASIREIRQEKRRYRQERKACIDRIKQIDKKLGVDSKHTEYVARNLLSTLSNKDLKALVSEYEEVISKITKSVKETFQKLNDLEGV